MTEGFGRDLNKSARPSSIVPTTDITYSTAGDDGLALLHAIRDCLGTSHARLSTYQQDMSTLQINLDCIAAWLITITKGAE